MDDVLGRAARRWIAFASVLAVSGSALVATPLPSGAAARPLAVYPLGDSITFGFTPEATTPGGYRAVVDAALTQAEVPHRLVGTSKDNPSPTQSVADQARHDGHNGYRIDQVTADLDGVAGAYDDRGGHWLTGTATRAPIVPDVVLVHLGTNDIAKRFDPANVYDDADPLDEPEQRAVFVASMTTRLRALIDKIQSIRPDAVVLVATVIPLDTGKVIDVVVPEYAVAVRSLVAELRSDGRAVRLVDAYQAFMTAGSPTPGLLSQDGAHPTPAGYAALGRLFADAIVAVR